MLKQNRTLLVAKRAFTDRHLQRGVLRELREHTPCVCVCVLAYVCLCIVRQHFHTPLYTLAHAIFPALTHTYAFVYRNYQSTYIH